MSLLISNTIKFFHRSRSTTCSLLVKTKTDKDYFFVGGDSYVVYGDVSQGVERSGRAMQPAHIVLAATVRGASWAARDVLDVYICRSGVAFAISFE